MRHKELIVTHIYAPDRSYTQLGAAINHAEIWSDQIHLTCRAAPLDIEYTVDTASKTREHANRVMRHHATKQRVDEYRADFPVPVCVAMEPDWLINDPHIVRDAIELSKGTMFARRYMMVNEDQYRSDGFYIPIPVAIAYVVRGAGRFSSEVNSAPDYAWTNQLRAEAPFEILDYQFKGADTSGATIRSYEGMIPILKEHA